MVLRNMGQICGMLLRSRLNEDLAHEDIRAFGAPSECVSDMRNSFNLDRCEIIEDAERSTGYTAKEMLAELEQRVSAKWLYQSGVSEAFGELLEMREQAEIDRRLKKYRNQSRLPGVRLFYY